jgi:hypothetical protein
MQNIYKSFDFAPEISQDTVKRIANLSENNGPLLALYMNTKNGYLYLFDWVDSDDKYNRWVVYRTDKNLVKEFVYCQLSLNDIFLNCGRFCHVIDIDDNITWQQINVVPINSLPAIYIPSTKNFFDVYDCADFDILQKFLNGN